MERCRLRVQPKNHIYTPKVQESVREWTHTPPSGVPLWELESLWSPKFSENSFKSQNSFDWKLFYIIGKLLKFRCLKWAYMFHLNTYNISYGRKKGQESEYKFDSDPLKVENCLYLHVCKQHPTYLWKALEKVYNFVINLTLIRSMQKKLWASKVAKVPIWRILGLLTWEF